MSCSARRRRAAGWTCKVHARGNLTQVASKIPTHHLIMNNIPLNPRPSCTGPSPSHFNRENMRTNQTSNNEPKYTQTSQIKQNIHSVLQQQTHTKQTRQTKPLEHQSIKTSKAATANQPYELIDQTQAATKSKRTTYDHNENRDNYANNSWHKEEQQQHRHEYNLDNHTATWCI